MVLEKMTPAGGGRDGMDENGWVGWQGGQAAAAAEKTSEAWGGAVGGGSLTLT